MTVTEWLLDADPAIRWQVMRDLTDEPAEVVAAERAKVAYEGWGDRLLALQGADGQWDGGTYFPSWATWNDPQPWTATAPTLALLRELGAHPETEHVQWAIELVRANSKWEHDGEDFFAGEVEPCINGLTVALGSYYGQDVRAIVDRLLGEQMADGGWNCEQENGSVRGSFGSTINVLEGLLEWERATGGTPEARAARERGEEYLLERRLFRRVSTGEVADSDWLQFSFPPRWHYDVLRGLDYFRSVGGTPDARLAEAVGVLEGRRDDEGRWPLENTHAGAVHFELEDGDGRPSRWNTLRALRVLRWWEANYPA
ncbi:hypothetical protein [Leifsonia poae]|uniref:hypothetical protein n=1 Tax=Leifsonia poae TaxID=110933 RepID=UPI003D67EA74